MKTKLLLSVAAFLMVVTGVLAVAWRPLPDNHLSIAGSSGTSMIRLNQRTSPPANASRKVTNAGLTVEIREYDLNPDNPTITICADLPSVADWLPRFSASYNGKEVGVWQVMLLDPGNTAAQEKNRCYLAMLSGGVFDKNSPGRLIFSLDDFEMSLPEKLPADIITQAQGRVKTSGIDFEVQDVSHGQNLVITKRPASMRQEDALRVVQQAIQDVTGRFQGPWVFTIDLNP